MSPAIAQIDASLARVHARLTMIRWEGAERLYRNESKRAAESGNNEASRAAEVWAELCAMRVKYWKEEADREHA